MRQQVASPAPEHKGELRQGISPELHKTLAIKAQQQKTSLNRYCEEQLMR
jgi:predicted HicB family RNase H-like nuclease